MGQSTNSMVIFQFISSLCQRLPEGRPLNFLPRNSAFFNWSPHYEAGDLKLSPEDLGKNGLVEGKMKDISTESHGICAIDSKGFLKIVPQSIGIIMIDTHFYVEKRLNITIGIII